MAKPHVVVALSTDKPLLAVSNCPELLGNMLSVSLSRSGAAASGIHAGAAALTFGIVFATFCRSIRDVSHLCYEVPS